MLRSLDRKAMPEISTSKSLRLVLFFSSFFLHSFTGLSNDPTTTKNNIGDASTKSQTGGTGTKVAIIIIAVAAVGIFSFFLFKLWQKKKREEQYARLLKLFEEDDELEVELGLRD